MAELRVYPLYMVQDKTGPVRLTSWDSAGSASFLSLEPRGATSYAAEAGLRLLVGRNASTDMELPVKRFGIEGERPGGAGRINLKTLTLSSTPLPEACGL